MPVNFVVTGATFDPEKNIIAKSNPIVISTLAAESFDLQQAVELYPNPANDYLNIQLPLDKNLESATIYNLVGQKVLETNLRNIYIQDLPSGIYYISIKANGNFANKRFVKK